MDSICDYDNDNEVSVPVSNICTIKFYCYKTKYIGLPIR